MAMSHENCTHPRTPAGRAACRKAGGPGNVTPQVPVKAMTTPAVSRPTKTRTQTRTVSLAGLPGTFRTAVDWAHANGCASAVLPADKGATMIRLGNDRGTLTLTWSPATPEGVHAVSWRPEGTSVATKIATVNEGLAKLKGA